MTKKKFLGKPKSNKPPEKELKKSKFTTGWKIITGILVLIGGFWTVTQIYNYNKSPKEKLEEATAIPGDLKPQKFNGFKSATFSPLERRAIYTNTQLFGKQPPSIKGILLKASDSSDAVVFIVGLTMTVVPIKQLYNGISLNVAPRGDCDTVKFIFGVRGDRLYTSCEFKNLATEETSGTIEFNHWTLYKEHLLYYKNDDSTLEVRDKQRYINFSLKYKVGNQIFNAVYIAGYFINPNSVSIFTDFSKGIASIQDTCYNKSDSQWKRKAEVPISRLISVYE